jgi:hypothetical protein
MHPDIERSLRAFEAACKEEAIYGETDRPFLSRLKEKQERTEKARAELHKQIETLEELVDIP